MANSASFTVNAAANPATHEVAYGATVTCTLLSITGANSIVWEIMSVSHEGMATPALSLSGTPLGQTATFTMVANPGGGSGRSVLIRCTVTNSAGARVFESALVGVPSEAGPVPLCPGETTERSSTHGYVGPLNVALAGVTGGGGGAGDVVGPASSVAGSIPAFADGGGKEIEDSAYNVSSVTKLTNVYYVDNAKTVSGTRDGSQARPFDTMTDALDAWKANGQNGVIFVGAYGGASFTFPQLGGGSNYLRIVGLLDNLGDGSGRAYVGGPNAAIEMAGNTLRLVLENVQIGNMDFVSNSGGSNLTINCHNSRTGDIDCNDDQIQANEWYWYDSYFYQDEISFGVNAAPGHFHNCLMGDITFAANGSKVYVVSPTNRNSDSGVPQAFTIAWPSSDASNKLYADALASYLAPTLTFGNLVKMTVSP